MVLAQCTLLLLCLCTSAGSAQAGRHCTDLSRLGNCVDHPRVRITKDVDTYQLTLCFDNQCSDNVTFDFRCSAICEACQTLLSSNDCDMHPMKCEKHIDTYLNNYCACTTIQSVNTASMETEQPLNCTSRIDPTQSVFRSKFTSIMICPSYTQPVTSGTRPQTIAVVTDRTRSTMPLETPLQSKIEVNKDLLVIVLGGLLGLSVLLLAVVTIGWMCTCRSKNQEAAKSRERATSTNDGSEVQSPTHASAIRDSIFLAARYEEVNLISEDNRGAAYHVIQTRAPHDNGGGLNHAHEHNESPRPLTRYDAVTYQTRENYNVLERGQRNDGEQVVGRDGGVTLEESCRDSRTTSSELPAVGRYDATNLLSEENHDYSVLERVEDNGEEDDEHERNSRSSNDDTTRQGEALYHVLESGEAIAGGDDETNPTRDQGESKNRNMPPVQYDEVYHPTEENDDNEVFYHVLESGKTNGVRDMKNNPRSYQGNLKDNFPPPPVRYDAVQIVSVSHDDGEDYDVLDRGQGNSVKEESYFKSFSFEGNKKDNVFFGVSYNTVNHPFSEHDEGGDYDVLDPNYEKHLKNSAEEGCSEDGGVQPVKTGTMNFISEEDDDADYDLLESLKV